MTSCKRSTRWRTSTSSSWMCRDRSVFFFFSDRPPSFSVHQYLQHIFTGIHLEDDHVVFSQQTSAKSPKRFAVNNSSKRALPDFGSGRCQSVITNAGPTIFLPAEGGIEVHLDPSVFSSARCTKAQKEEALRAMTVLPKKVQWWKNSCFESGWGKEDMNLPGWIGK